MIPSSSRAPLVEKFAEEGAMSDLRSHLRRTFRRSSKAASRTSADVELGTERGLGDFTTTTDVLRLIPLAILVGVLGAGISLGLLDMIGFFTNLFYFQRISVHLVSPYANTLGPIAILIPIAGGLVVGLMARFGSEQIRGHGIPEAMERILIHGSRVQPRLAILKPVASAVVWSTGTTCSIIWSGGRL